ncbi:MAG: cellulase family glycosylhydrolase [Verrucomicrobia bacterium]|nr:cellulase family glycosylhydrolase [Verrucomicrobiota bacterium]
MADASLGRWSIEKARAWYASQPWPCGFNYIPANAISYTEMWMPYCFDPKRIDAELALAQDIGFNGLRVVLPFVVWEHDPATFKTLLNTFLGVCDARGLKVMFTIFDDCVFGSDDKLINPWYGKQPDILEGWYANGWTPSPGHDMVRDTHTWPRLERYVKDVIGTFRHDPRAWVWDLYNEPCNSGTGDATLPLVEQVFRWARQAAPSQPLTVGSWNWERKLEDIIHRQSDILTFHSYDKAENLTEKIAGLKLQGRPMINTEWLNRPNGSLVETCLPIFKRENVGCMHWGLVNGKTQTHLGWGCRPGSPAPERWQHDLFHGDHTPYNFEELTLFRTNIASRSDGS